MPRLSFEQLLGLYRGIDFDPHGDEGSLHLTTAEQLDDLQFIENDDTAGDDANLAVLCDPAILAIGQKVRVRVGSPRIGLGLLARSVDDLLKTPEARITEPKAYFVVDGRIEPQSTATPAICAYRQVLEVVALFSKAAAYLDRTRQELVFVHEGKVVVPIRYDATVLSRVSQIAIDELLENFKDDVHKDQKLAILEDAIIQMVAAQPAAQRFIYVLDNISTLSETVRQGYRLFASSFSYAKIRNEIEAAQVDYIGKIHKTLIDIQGQLLGIPIATVIVASQLKAATTCGLDFWTNIAVLSGAWIFVGLLGIAIINQWVTLSSISQEIDGQKRRLNEDYAAIAIQFLDLFSRLDGRICWHRAALLGVGCVAIAGAAFATYVFVRITPVEIGTCIASIWL
ncbi:hypothetical protein [Xanthobacter wiegelii]|uniref:hypothetical protein n=1 Tax=Xanthobacter wiegelii TaxID=3119913 RepID=UPI0037278CB6